MKAECMELLKDTDKNLELLKKKILNGSISITIEEKTVIDMLKIRMDEISAISRLVVDNGH